jgi:SAM-dependent methyltransferase
VSTVAELGREKRSCSECGSTVRCRQIVHLLSVALFGQSLALPDFPERPDIKGVGMSDWNGYAVPLASKCNYQNTYYDEEPKLDIVSIDPALEGQFDFIISSEVFEHVPPPVSIAFENAYRLLKPNGVLVFTVPYITNGQTTEHFPELYDYQLIETDGHYILRNITKAGITQVFENLIFHLGPGETLEMRLFSESSLIDEFKQAGFKDIQIHKTPCFEYGIYAPDDWSLPMTVRKP